ncbi:hypothetical protein [Chromobacterium sp. IIBBL 290-4]|uniref:hypothetical protein n=1 Tax=Chromobacterium sp. IIBBL 290-4 TaxID=2953890 RepID=UPI0020B68581|nr:hypothetical protein [Chromobacterium sp. IIBBL 290-4]UTH76103.1 hypothetical protein NKT35_08375 [Chromobacterium sp. IIBBL 290-4]
MKQFIFDKTTRRCIGCVEGVFDGYHGQGLLVDADHISPDVETDDMGSLYLSDDGVTVKQDRTAQLAQAKSGRKARIKAEAARLIEATAWKLERARERETAGWGSLAEVDAVLAEREAIRRSSSAAELALDTLTDVASVQAFAWSVDVQVAAPRRLTHKQFLARFSDSEIQAMLKSVADNSPLRPWWERFSLASDISLDDPATQAGAQAMEDAGLIAKGRAAEVLGKAPTQAPVQA